MKIQDLPKKFLLLLLFCLLLQGLSENLFANNTLPIAIIQEQPLPEIFEEIGDTDQAFFRYEPRLIKGIYVDFNSY